MQDTTKMNYTRLKSDRKNSREFFVFIYRYKYSFFPNFSASIFMKTIVKLTNWGSYSISKKSVLKKIAYTI